MKIKSLVAAGLVVFAFSSSAAIADELLITSDSASKRGGAQLISLDLMSDGLASGVEVRIDIPAAKGARVDTSNCAKMLPKTHVGSCVFNGKEVVVLLYSMKNSILPSGMIDLGTISIETNSNARSRAGTKPKVTSFISAAPGGKQIEAKVHSAL